MIRNISIGIDLGSAVTKVIVAEFVKGEKNPRVIGLGESESNGLRHGYVTNLAEATNSLKKALSQAERSSGLKIKKAFVSINSLTLRSELSNGSAIISKADGEVTSLDINKALEEAEEDLNLNNKKIIRAYPVSFKLDGKEIFGRPEGLRGTKLEVKALFITCSSLHFDDLLEVVTSAGVEPLDILTSAEADSNIALTEKQKIVGVALVNIGAETVSLSIYENNLLSSLYTFSIGGSDITNDIALGLKIPLNKAEKLKLGIDVEDISKKKLDEIIEARLTDIFELIQNYLRKIKRNELLPAGIIFVGGGANTKNLEELSKDTLKLPSQIASTEIFGNTKTKLRDPAWFTSLGLIMAETKENLYGSDPLQNVWKNLKRLVKTNIRQLLP